MSGPIESWAQGGSECPPGAVKEAGLDIGFQNSGERSGWRRRGTGLFCRGIALVLKVLGVRGADLWFRSPSGSAGEDR